jgi:hypothetical protein
VFVIVIVLVSAQKQQLRLEPKTNAQLIDQLITLACVHWHWREEKNDSSPHVLPLNDRRRRTMATFWHSFGTKNGGIRTGNVLYHSSAHGLFSSGHRGM